jgi:hypothetical protein
VTSVPAKLAKRRYSVRIEDMFDGLVRWLGIPMTVGKLHMPIEQWRALQDFVSKLDQTLGPLHKM